MNMYTIIIVSNDHNYNSMLADKLREHYHFRPYAKIISDDLQLDLLHDLQESHNSHNHILAFLGTAIDGCLRDCSNCRSSSNCLTDIYSKRLSGVSDYKGYHFCREHFESDTAVDGSVQVKWPAPVSEIIRLLDCEINETGNSQDEYSEQSSDCQITDEGIMCLHLTLSCQNSNRLNELIKMQLKQGKKIYYLAVMPGWCMQFCCAPDTSGPDLSSLLLSIYQHCPPEAAKIGIYTQMHPNGYLQFRPPARGDDLISCEPEHLRKMLMLIRQKVKSEKSETICWIDCRDISIQTAGRLAAVCDHILLDLPADDSYASLTARREAGLLLASLPNSCSIYEDYRQLKERL